MMDSGPESSGPSSSKQVQTLKLLIRDRLHLALLHRDQCKLGPSVQVAQETGEVSLIVKIFSREPVIAINL